MHQIAVIGGGAAGCFCAVNLGRTLRKNGVSEGVRICLYESGPKLLAKVAVTGGGRCNYTNTFEGIKDIREAYPRGWQFMRRAMKSFSQDDVIDWFAAEGIRPAIQDDHCVFPETQDAMHVVRVLERGLRHEGVEVRTGAAVRRISASEDGAYVIELDGGSVRADTVIVTTGGGAMRMLEGLDLAVETPVPSLFTFRIADAGLRSLMGAVVPGASLRLAGTTFRSEGALLLTDWGVSGPATLKLSSYAARFLSEHQYRATLLVGWVPSGEEEVREWLVSTASEHSKRQLGSIVPEGLTSRLWKHVIARAGLRDGMTWAELGPKGLSRLVSRLTADEYPIEGRCHFKEEFVTCGGVALSNVDLSTLECRKLPGLYFAGEILDIDAVTGGFNLQAAWTCGWTVAGAVAEKLLTLHD